jgi:hypothetical protein
MMLGSQEGGRPSVVLKLKQTNWGKMREFIGWTINTREKTAALSKKKLDKLREILKWWRQQSKVTARDVWKLVGRLYWASLAIRPGRFFTSRLIWLTVKTEERRKIHPSAPITLDVESMADIEMWDFLLAENTIGETEGKEWVLAAPIALHMRLEPVGTWLSDASHLAIGGFAFEQNGSENIFWVYYLTEADKARLVKGKKKGPKVFGEIHVNLLELIGMVITSFVMAIEEEKRPTIRGVSIRLIGDNQSAVSWLQNAGGVREERAGRAIRLLGIIEAVSQWSFDAAHIAGKKNITADGITRIPYSQIRAFLATRARGEWREFCLPGAMAGALLSQLLDGSSSQNQSERELWESISRTGDYGANGGGV